MPKYRVRLDNDQNKEYTIKDGFIYEDTLNETLDSAKVVFETEEDTDIGSFDDITIFDDSVIPFIKDKDMLVDSGTDEIAYFEPIEGKTYELNLFSHTKWLERFPCPNLAITNDRTSVTRNVIRNVNVKSTKNSGSQHFKISLDKNATNITFNLITISVVNPSNYSDPFTQVESNDQFGNVVYRVGDNDNPDVEVEAQIRYSIQYTVVGSKTVFDYIERYCTLYIPKVHVRDSNQNLEYANRYKLSKRIQGKFQDIVCPEMQWNNPTLREVLTDLMSTANCIPIINNDNEIDYLDLSLMGKPIDTTKLDRIRSSFTSADYCNELTINLKNSIGKTKTRLTEYTSLRSLTGEITTGNAVLKTQKPIYNVIKVTLCYSEIITGGNDTYRYRELDITNYVVEKRVWDTFTTTNTFYDANKSTLKANHLYYTRGQNTIDGWGLTYRMIPVVQGTYFTNSTSQWIIRSILQSSNLHNGTDLRDLMVKLEYETVTEHSMHIGKYLPSKHYGNRLFDNQSNSYVDVQHQSIYEYAKVNRLGNKIRTAYAIYNQETDLPKLGDYITISGEKYILYNRKIQYYDSQINFEGLLVSNYVLQNYFTGIMAKKRSWAIAEGKEALERRDIYKYYLEASFYVKEDDNIMSYYYYYDILRTLLGAFYNQPSGGSALQYVLVKVVTQSYNYYPSAIEYFSLETSLEIAGNSLIIPFNMGDNFSAGSYVSVDDDGAYHNNDYRYVDENGEFKGFYELIFPTYVDPANGDWDWPSDGDEVEDADKQRYISIARIKNKINYAAIEDSMFFKLPIIPVYKDNREIIAGEVQFELCSDTPNIIVKNTLWELCSLYNDKDYYYYRDLIVVVSNTETYELYDEYGKGTPIQAGGLAIQLTNNRVSISYSGSFKSWAICDLSGKILIAVNSSSKKTVALNLLSTRDRNIYDKDTRIPIGRLPQHPA